MKVQGSRSGKALGIGELLASACSAEGSTKFTLFETVTSLVPPTLRGAAHRWPPLALVLAL